MRRPLPARPARRRARHAVVTAAGLLLLTALPVAAQRTAAPAARPDPRVEAAKRALVADVDARAKLTQEINDQIFSFGELGMQEVETSRYLVALLRREGFTVTEGYAGMPTAWVATWGSGKPVIALGSDIDGIPQASQMPGVACRLPMIPGAPGHGEGHNSGQAVVITAALAVKKLMEEQHLPGTIKLWPGVAEEQLGAKAFFTAAGLFRDVDVSFFTHVYDDFSTPWGAPNEYSGLVSLLYSFEGTTAHAAGAPWRGRSALDAVELMNTGWNFRREHLRTESRSHYVIRDGGDQPNVVPATASVWYFLRELDAPRIRTMWAMADSVAQGAAMMTGTRLANVRVMGAAWPPHFNRPVAEALARNIERVGMPRWSEDDQRFARAIQQEMGQPQRGLTTTPKGLEAPPADDQRKGGGSDDIGDVSWAVPTVQLFYPSNVPGTPGHNWADAIAMATPIAHKGATAGAKALALTVYDVLTSPALVADAWRYYREVQTKDVRYESFVRPQDRPSTELNAAILARYRDQMRPFYYDASRFPTYLDQLGVKYPTLRGADGSCGAKAVP
ncbi:MAG: amidohydrolase [Gemmatimonadaceae bacterium]|nr:amidohydrolase [Gemmatimonadaceae bacterium]